MRLGTIPLNQSSWVKQVMGKDYYQILSLLGFSVDFASFLSEAGAAGPNPNPPNP
jgi:hypothetical protein